MIKMAIVCNSTNIDLVDYFKCKISINPKSTIAFKNRKINLDSAVENHISSFMNKAFFDKFVIVDLFISFYLFFVVFAKNIKVIHFTTAHISNVFLATLLKPFSIKLVFTIHDLSPHPGGKSYFIKLYNDFVINVLADEIITFSKSEIVKQKNKIKFKYFPLTGFKLKQKNPKIGRKTILFFGRMESYKGFNNLLNVISLANKEKLNYKFIIAGKGNIPNKELLLEYENVTIQNKFISDDELEKLFYNATFSILPYDSATQSGVILLSYSYATPVIAYDVGSLGEYIENGKNGFCIPKFDDKQIINILQKYDEKQIYEFSKNVISIFQEKYSVEKCKDIYKKYYNTLIGEE